MIIDLIRKSAPVEEFDYNLLMNSLADYRNPRDVVTRLIGSGAIVRVKKGLYVFGPDHAKEPFSRETLANLIYGPSYISLEFALSYYGLIPERIETVTSITNKRNKFFKTPVGNFSYTYTHPQRYSAGITQVELDARHNILIATREKALVDKVDLVKGISSLSDIQKYLFEDMRLDEQGFKEMKVNVLRELAAIFESRKIELLYKARKGGFKQ